LLVFHQKHFIQLRVTDFCHYEVETADRDGYERLPNNDEKI